MASAFETDVKWSVGTMAAYQTDAAFDVDRVHRVHAPHDVQEAVGKDGSEVVKELNVEAGPDTGQGTLRRQGATRPGVA